MNNRYLIPANSKRSLLILGIFTLNDLIMFGTGAGITLLLLMIMPIQNFLFTILAMLPGLITGFLVVPIPNYLNVRTLIKEMIEFAFERRAFVWKGWGASDEKQ